MQDLLGDLIPKGGGMWIKARHIPNKGGEMFPRRKSILKKWENADWIKSTYERRIANRGRNKGGSWF